MKFSHQLTYDASPDAVHAMLADRLFREKVCEAMRAVRHEVRIAAEAPGLEVVVDQTQPADGIPPFAQKFVGHEIRIVQRESWSGPAAATLNVEIPGKPGHLTGGIALSGDDARTTESVTGDLKVSIPLVGGRLESLIADLLKAALRTEEKVGRRWLAGER
jgi:hypothetical protein